MKSDLTHSLPLQTQGELVAEHGIDPILFAPEALILGPSLHYESGLEAWAREKAAGTVPGQTGARSGHQRHVREALARAEGGWSLVSVKVNKKGWPTSGEAFLGHRIHPNRRRPGDRMKIDVRGWDAINHGLALPPFSYQGAVEHLADYGFSMPAQDYLPWKAWDFIARHQEIPIWIEESALKAMAACSIGQIAVGVNGINGAGQPGRSDRLHPTLKLLARHGRSITVRFDRPEKVTSKSAQVAQYLARKLEKEGASSSWWCWLPAMPAKTDDFIAAMIRGELAADQKVFLDTKVSTAVKIGSYRRLAGAWPRHRIDREFQAADVLGIAGRVVVLKGATGTAKSKAFVDAITQLEAATGQKQIVLGAYHRASLVHKGAAEFGVCDLSALAGSAEREGLHGAVGRAGLFCCGESAYKDSSEMTLWRWFWELKEKPRPAVLILDEISQVLANWVMGGTDALRSIRGKALDALEGLVGLECVKVWAADALVGDVEMEWLKGLTGETPALVESSFTRPRPLYLAEPTKHSEQTVVQALTAAANKGSRFWLGCGTPTTLHRLLDALPEAAEGTELRITGEDKSRADPRVMRLMADTEAEGATYQRVGFSPAVSCGISMAETPVNLTAVVQEFCWAAEDVLQALNRARNTRERILLAPKAVPEAAGITKETSAFRAAKALKESMEAGSLKDYAALIEQRHPATRKAVAELEARRNLEALANQWCLRGLLAEEGYIIEPLDKLILEGAGPDQNDLANERKALRTPEGIERHRLTALQRLVAGTTSIDAEQHLAKRLIEGGTFLDLKQVDVSEAWAVAQELQLDILAGAGIVHATSEEVVAVWEQLSQLDRQSAKRASRALGVRSDRLPGPLDTLDVRKVWPLLKRIGYGKGKPVGETRAEGKKWEITPICLDPPKP